MLEVGRLTREPSPMLRVWSPLSSPKVWGVSGVRIETLDDR